MAGKRFRYVTYNSTVISLGVKVWLARHFNSILLSYYLGEVEVSKRFRCKKQTYVRIDGRKFAILYTFQ